jgi:hypothetical protein
MSPILISVILVLVVVFGTAIWMDVKRRRLGDTQTSGVMGKARRQAQLESRERGSKWGVGG